MSEDVLKVGTLRAVEGRYEGKLERVLEHPRAEVWKVLTESDSLGKWLASGSIEQELGGAVKIDFADSGTVIDSRVSALEPGRLLSYSWSHGTEPERPLRWELEDADGNTRVTLTVRVPADEDAAKACAGFEAHLHMLAAVLEGVPIKFPFQLYVAAREAYKTQLGQ